MVPATGTAERETAIEMLAELQSRDQVTVGADKAYDTHEFVERVRDLNVTPLWHRIISGAVALPSMLARPAMRAMR